MSFDPARNWLPNFCLAGNPVTRIPDFVQPCNYNAESHRGEGSQITKSFFWTAPYMNEELGIRKQNNKPLQPLNIIIYKTGENDADCQS